MKIEVIASKNMSNTDKGNLLEKLTKEVLENQSYQVTKQLRITAKEIDLLCEHKVNRKTIYVECKARRDAIGANVLTNLLGTINLKNYQEGWLITTSQLGKDAKGFKNEWEKKPQEEYQKLSIYTPERVLETLIKSRVIVPQPDYLAKQTIKNTDNIGDWMLLISEYGNYWALTTLESGIPKGVLVFSTTSGDLISDVKLLKNLSSTDSTISNLNFEYISKVHRISEYDGSSALENVVEVQTGNSWDDYRPARPQDFVGRHNIQKIILGFLKDIPSEPEAPRIFAIKANSGMGKSSLIAKIRDRSRNRRHRRKIYVYAVDIRAATNPNYILWSLLACLREAASNGFGTESPQELKITNPSEPLSSESIQSFLKTLEEREQVVCLILDQFEELYSKEELFDVFNLTKNLMHSTMAQKSNFALGFAWKTDSTVQQDHPAYHMWHNLRDHRYEIDLKGFNASESATAISIFEGELEQRLRPDLRKHLIDNSQGFPWLLKKLCIHLYQQMNSGISQTELIDKALDVETLFERDLQDLSQPELVCLRLIAKDAPSDWYAVLKNSGKEVLNSLLDKRLIIRSGDRINMYWDIFREYVNTKKVPSIPLLYLPVSPSIKSMLRVATLLHPEQGMSHKDLAKLSNLSEKTVMNVISDLVIFGIAIRKQNLAFLENGIPNSERDTILKRIRDVLKRHAIMKELSGFEDYMFDQQDIVTLLKSIYSSSSDKESTWKTRANRIASWLQVSGYLIKQDEWWIVKDLKTIQPDLLKTGVIQQRHVFIAPTSPAKTLATFNWISENQPVTWQKIKENGFRGGLDTLRFFSLVSITGREYSVIPHEKLPIEIIYEAASKDKTLEKVIAYLRNNPNTNGHEVGEFIKNEYDKKWADSSVMRTGNAVMIWARWLLIGSQSDKIPNPPGIRFNPTEEDQISFV